MVDQTTIESEVRKMLALDFNCNPEDFGKKENVIVVPKEHPGRREYAPKKPFFSMVTMGKNTVINAPEEMHGYLGDWCKGREGIWLFEHHNLMELEEELAKYGKRLWQTHHMFLPKARMEEVDVEFGIQRGSVEALKPEDGVECDEQEADIGFEIRWFEQKDIHALYGRPEFPNALCDCFKLERPDVLSVGALQDGKIVGLAGCSADTKLFWQIGIDVLPEWRGKGIATMLVKLLKNECFRRGAIPFYGTSLSNLGSWHVALGSGFYPAWVEIATREV